MSPSDLRYSREPDENWHPQANHETLAQQLLPWAAGSAVFCIVVTVTSYLQETWPGSPLLFIARLVGRLVLAIISLVVGLIRWFTTGNAEVLKNIPDCFRSESASVFSPLILGVIAAVLTVKVFRRTELKRSTSVGVLIASAIIPILLITASGDGGLNAWFSNMWQLLETLWGSV